MKSILVHLTGKPCDDDVLAAAAVASREFPAHLDCLYVRPDPLAPANSSSDLGVVTSGTAIEMVRTIEQSGAEGARKSRDTYDRFLRAQSIPELDAPSSVHHQTAAYREDTGDVVGVLIEAARNHDLTILAGGSSLGPTLATADVGSILIESGRPLFLAPEEYGARSFRTIAIAWKNRPEAAHAVTAAMPLLKKAERIVVLGAREAEPCEKFTGSLDMVVTLLHWHGLKAESRIVPYEDLSIPERVLKSARHYGADLLIMGAYGHSRLRELIFGGFTERVLRGVDIPVVVTH